MADTITKILFRKGLDITRRTGGGFGVVLNEGEPGFCLDTGRLYVGDGSTVGGRNIGMINHGAFATLSSAALTYYNFTESAYATLTAEGVDKGDLIYDDTNSILYYVTSNTTTSAVPPWSQIKRYNLIGNVTSHNGVSSQKIQIGDWGQVIADLSLNPAYFECVGNLVTIPVSLTVQQTTNLNQSVNIGGITTINANLDVVGGNITSTGSIGSNGVVYAQGNTAPNNSNYWGNAWTNLNSNSGGWTAAQTLLTSLTPLAWKSPIVGDVTYTQISNGVPSTTVKAGINNNNTTVVGLVVQGTDTTTTALRVIGGIEATGDITALVTSDERLKTNVSVITDALNIIDQIDGVEFDWNCDWKSGPDVGVLAQQVEKVFPKVVVNRENGYKAVNYEKLIPLLIQCIKELKAKL